MPSKTPENEAKLIFEKHITKISTIKLFSNLRGNFWSGQPTMTKPGTVLLRFARRMKAGFGPDGTPDFCGWRQITITPDMVGETVAQFCAAELKRFDGKGKTTVEQIDMLELINKQGGYAKLIDSEESMKEAFGNESV